ncbi:hypothetical protein B7486_73465, partial [cyanobacterium TDX16]
QALRNADPAPSDAVEALDLTEAVGQLATALTATGRDVLELEPQRPRREQRFPWTFTAAAAAVVLVVLGAAIYVGHQDAEVAPTGGHSPRGVAPHYVVEGWDMTRIDEGNVPLDGLGAGAEFQDDHDRTLLLGWAPAELHDETLEGHRGGRPQVEDVDVDGVPAALVGGAGNGWIAVWQADGVTMSAILNDVGSESDVRHIL